MKLILFDIDGTLLLTGGAGQVAFDRTFAELFDVQGAWKNVIPDGKTDPVIIDELIEMNLKGKLSKKEYQRLCDTYCIHFEKAVKESPRFRLMPNAKNLVTDLDQFPKVVLGVATGNFEKTAKLKLQQAKLIEYFPFGGYASDSADRLELTKKAIQRGEAFHNRKFDPNDIYLIGDSVHDIRVAHQLGVHGLCVMTGSTSEDTLRSEKPDHLWAELPSFNEICQILSME